MAEILQPLTLTASTSVTRKAHGMTICRISAAAGLTITLPAAVGAGVRFRFYIGTTVTSNNVVIQVTGDDIMSGLLFTAQDSADTANAWETAADTDTITLNGSTKGGIKGDYIELEDVAADTWQLRGWVSGTGTEATMFSAAVS